MSQSIKLDNNTFIDAEGVWDNERGQTQEVINRYGVHYETIGGAALLSEYPLGINLESVGSTAGDWPDRYALVMTVKATSARGIQISSSYQGVLKYRADTTNNSWTAWQTVTLT